MRTALITGVTGHVGRELARQLVAVGVHVHGLTRHSLSDAGWTPAVEMHRIDGSTDTLLDVLGHIRPDCVFHLAALYQREHEPCDVVPLIESNIRLGTQLLEAMRRAGCSRFVTASTYFQHFSTGNDSALNLYAATKQAFESVLEYFVDAFGVAATCLMLYEIYSEHDTRRKLIPALVSACRSGTAITLPTDEMWMDFVHVEDVAAAFVHAAHLLERGTASGPTLQRYSACSSRDVSISELVQLVERISGQSIKVERSASVLKARRIVRPWRGAGLPDWAPRITLEEGLARIFAQPVSKQQRDENRV